MSILDTLYISVLSMAGIKTNDRRMPEKAAIPDREALARKEMHNGQAVAPISLMGWTK